MKQEQEGTGMVQTNLQDLHRYQTLHKRFAAAFDALARVAAEPFREGIHVVDADDIYINALEYDTVSTQESMMEEHRQYIDVMLLLEGEETIGVCHVNALRQITAEYDPAVDALLAKLEASYSALSMRPGDVAILFPEDAHAPGMNSGTSRHVRKLIAKVRVQ